MLNGQKYTIMTAPSLVGQLEAADGLELSSEIRKYKLRHFFGSSISGSNWEEVLALYNHDRTTLISRNELSSSQKHIDTMSRALERTVYDLISFNESWIDQSSWERRSKTIVQAGSATAAAVSFFPLIESYVGEISITALLGRNFLENNPGFLDDLYLWNWKGTSFMKRIPLFLPQMSGPAAARDRVLRSLRRFRDILTPSIPFNNPGSDWGDLTDVSPIINERINRRKDGSTHPTVNRDALVDVALVWTFNKPNTLTAWLLYRVYSDSALLAAVRKEIKPFVDVEYLKSELPIDEPPRVKIDSEGLVRKARLLREVMNETIRLHTTTITYGVATKDITLTESHDDAASLGKDKPDAYLLRKGELVCVPSQATEKGPGIFNPAGFHSLANLKGPSTLTLHTPHMNHAFGVGRVSCPGKELAEREILVIAAVILSMWEVDCKSQWPGQQPGLCSSLPLEDIRVTVSRREAEEETE